MDPLKTPVKSFATLFGLRDPRRASFGMRPEHDANLLVDIDHLVPKAESWLIDDRVPKTVIYGDYGTGKTHLLRYIDKVLCPRVRYRSAFVELAGFGRRSTFYDVHVRVMSVLLDILEDHLLALKPAQVSLAIKSLVNKEIEQVFARLQDDKLPLEQRATLRAWLLGTGPTPTQARKQGLTGPLWERASATDLVRLWQTVGKLQIVADGKKLLLLVDEGESFQKIVHPDSLSTIAAGLRGLFDPDNDALAVIFALNLPAVRGHQHPFIRTDIQSRIQDILNLDPLSTPERIKAFVRALWMNLSEGKTPLFTDEALDLLANRLAQFRTAISRGQHSPVVTPTQRDLFHVLDTLGSIAFQQQRPPPLQAEHLRTWIPGGVGES